MDTLGQDNGSLPPMYFIETAIFGGAADVTELMLERLQLSTEARGKALQLLAEAGLHKPMANWLATECAARLEESDFQKSLRFAASKGHVQVVRVLLNHTIVWPQSTLANALNSAAYFGQEGVVREFLTDGRVELDAQNLRPLTLAAQWFHLCTLDVLLHSDTFADSDAGARLAMSILAIRPGDMLRQKDLLEHLLHNSRVRGDLGPWNRLDERLQTAFEALRQREVAAVALAAQATRYLRTSHNAETHVGVRIAWLAFGRTIRHRSTSICKRHLERSASLLSALHRICDNPNDTTIKATSLARRWDDETFDLGLINEEQVDHARHAGGDSQGSLRATKVLGIAVHVLCGLSLLLVIGWFASSKQGYSWQTSDPGVFAWHPTLMVLGLVVCYAEAVISWRAFGFIPRPVRKIVHVVLHTVALVAVVVGLRAVFRFHNENQPKPIPNLYSFHSWLGLITVILFFAQYVIGFWAFFYPKAQDALRAALVPLHARAGLLLFVVCVAATVTTGVLEKLTFMSSCNSKTDGTADKFCYMGNFLALTVVVLACVVGAIVSLPTSKSILVAS
ncbi:Cytochrome b reductase 1 [Hondaea fermentalgiana]|uniref:Cytochrome b reductase 1 n=1 Tax=Hondaea fermentalgiana TaxID=2315210 RepID=A0A2R5GKV9_9STRA|nr:Cytochrome b reductase 1 [Hondaea fermentalgiana]|eukprot:GBG30368.1 Cytochrome b reductase 1 [Hondaea fermentalgiana]